MLAVAIGIAAAALPGAGGPAAQTAGTTFSHTVEPRQIAEECFGLPAGQSIAYAFETTGPVDFNIHYHRANDVFYPVQADRIWRADDRFTATSTEDFCLMWTNQSSQAVTVRGDLRR